MRVLVQCRDRPGRHELLREASTSLEKYGLEISDNPEIIISLGGDGTTLYSCLKFRKPILPVRAFTSQGYITDFGMDRIDEACEKLSKDLFYIDRRMMLDYYKNDAKMGSVANEVTIFQAPRRWKAERDFKTYEAMRYSVHADGKPLFGYDKLIGDGVTVSTPTGSTAYNRSALGYVINPNSHMIVVTLRYPICLELKNQRSRILDGNSVIEFGFYKPTEAFLVADVECREITNSDVIKVKKSDNTFDLVKVNGMRENRSSKERRRKEWFTRQEF